MESFVLSREEVQAIVNILGGAISTGLPETLDAQACEIQDTLAAMLEG